MNTIWKWVKAGVFIFTAIGLWIIYIRKRAVNEQLALMESYAHYAPVPLGFCLFHIYLLVIQKWQNWCNQTSQKSAWLIRIITVSRKRQRQIKLTKRAFHTHLHNLFRCDCYFNHIASYSPRLIFFQSVAVKCYNSVTVWGKALEACEV